MKVKDWFNALSDMGCIVCLNEHGVVSQPDIHHLTSGSKRIGDLHTIPLCPTHHRFGINNSFAVSRHPWKREFERRYGTEAELYAQVLKLVTESFPS
jgi:hypothetical protein